MPYSLRTVSVIGIIAIISNLCAPILTFAMSAQVAQVGVNLTGWPSGYTFTVGEPNPISYPLRIQTRDILGNAETVTGGDTVRVRVTDASALGGFELEANHDNGAYTNSSIDLEIVSGRQNTEDFYYMSNQEGVAIFEITILDNANGSTQLVNGSVTNAGVEFVIFDPNAGGVVGGGGGSGSTQDPIASGEPFIFVTGNRFDQHPRACRYVDDGATAWVPIENGSNNFEITDRISTSNNVNVQMVGNYVVDYSVGYPGTNGVTDHRYVEVFDRDMTLSCGNDSPIITLNGDAEMTILRGGSFDDPGASATDPEEGDISSRIVRDGVVNENENGRYELTYSVADSDGNTIAVRRIVNVVGDLAPVITLTEDPVNHVVDPTVAFGGSYVEFGAMAVDDIDGDISANIVIDHSAVDTSNFGIYNVIYSVTDSHGNLAQEVRAVTVADLTAPEITLLGDAVIDLTTADVYHEQGAIAWDNVDGDVSANIVVDSSSLNMRAPGTYTVYYRVSDSAQNLSEATRVIHVIDGLAPVITLIGPDIVEIPLDGVYTDPGVTAIDDVDGDISARVVIDDSQVLNFLPGEYIVGYAVSDSSGNHAINRRRVIVDDEKFVDPSWDVTPPVITLIGDPVLTIPLNGTYIEYGATAMDNVDGDISANIVIDSSHVDTSALGHYVVSYGVGDNGGSYVIQIREVNVVANFTSNPSDSSSGSTGSGSSNSGSSVPASGDSRGSDVQSEGGGVPAGTPGWTALPGGGGVSRTEPLIVEDLNTLVSNQAPQSVLGLAVSNDSAIDRLTNELRPGTNGEEVAALQDTLRDLGFFPNNIRSTGYYGSYTTRAVIAYARSLGNDGILNFLIAHTGFGQANEMVLILQNELLARGLFGHYIPTGYYGVNTERLVNEYLNSSLAGE